MENYQGEQIQAGPATPIVLPIGEWIFAAAASCYAGRVSAAAISELHCRHYGGVRSASYGWCGGSMTVECFERPQAPPQPVQPNPPGNGGGGGCSGCVPPRLMFVGFSSSVPQGTVTVGDIVNDDAQ